MDYEKLSEITVKNQEELDAIPVDFKGRIYVEFGDCFEPAVVNKKYGCSVVARGNSSVVARGNSSVEARENSSVEARENSSVEAWENSSVTGQGNTQIVDRLMCGRIEITGNARVVHMPKTIEEYCSYYNIKHDKKKGRFFKCVHKRDGKYFSDWDGEHEYVIGEKSKADYLDDDTEEDCGHGIHIAYLEWALDYGRKWEDLAILEVEAELDSIILPTDCPGKARCLEVDVIREVPLEECGLYGKIIARRIGAK